MDLLKVFNVDNISMRISDDGKINVDNITSFQHQEILEVQCKNAHKVYWQQILSWQQVCSKPLF